MKAVSWMFAAALVLGPCLTNAQTPVQTVIGACDFNFRLAERQPVQGLPFAATGAVTLEQVLADGSVVKNAYDVAVWRDTEGRLRVECTLPFHSNAKHPMVTVTDLGNGTEMSWFPDDRHYPVSIHHRAPVQGTSEKVALAPQQRTPSNSQITQSENLPADIIAGLNVTGVRTTKIIPAGTVGNDRDLTVTSETWTSPDLKIIVRQITNDPRSGKVTTELTSITRTDPDPALFQAPEGYPVRDTSLPATASH